MANDLEQRVRTSIGRTRHSAGLSLEELSERCGISTSTLSRIESGGRRVTVDSLDAIASALDTTAVALLADAAREDRLLLPTPEVPLQGGMTGILLRNEDDGRQLLRITIPARRRLPEGRVHPGSEWLHVLRGRLRLQVAERELVLEPGQTAQFDTSLPHAFAGIDGEAEVLSRFEPGSHR